MNDFLYAPAIDPAIDLALRIALALLLFLSAFRKIADFPAFRAAVEAYRIVPPAAVGGFAGTVVLLEKLAAVGLVASPIRGPFALLAASLFAVFAVAIGVNLLRGRRDIDCGCGGAGSELPIHPALVVRNLALVCASMAVVLPSSGRSMEPVDAVTVLGGILSAALLYKAVEGLIATASGGVTSPREGEFA
jgi:hypothetical protein